MAPQNGHASFCDAISNFSSAPQFGQAFNTLPLHHINLFGFLSGLARGRALFKTGVIFIPLGAALAYYIYGTPESACLGVQVVFMIRHMIRDLLYSSIIKLARWGR